MKLLDALEILKKPLPESTAVREMFLLCGFTPLHLQTFLAAHMRLAFPASAINIKTGLYGDLAGNLDRLRPINGAAACVVVEWPDLDPRLGIRSLGSWDSAMCTDIVESARRQGERLALLIRQAAEKMPVYVSMPTLPLPPIFVTTLNQAQNDEWELREIVARLAVSLSTINQVKIVNPQRLDERSPFSSRFNPKGELTNGFPYSMDHACSLAELFAILIKDAPPRKGLITDLDDTLWSGILGEVGIDGICWDMSSNAHIHGLYQRFLGSLASAGVLLAVASKNEQALVEKALEREDMLIAKDKLFPLEAHWGIKSQSVERVLKLWNIASNDVVFIDDSPMEVAEVQSAFPEMECIVFPKDDSVAVWELLKHLRNRFGKTAISLEDSIRLESIRSSEAFRNVGDAFDAHAEGFLRDAEATISFTSKPDVNDSRAFELINKTNQFNLNGKRLERSEWFRYLSDPDSFLVTATYEDKYGPLGKIAVIMGKTRGSTVYVQSWVMSCRAFSRGIEHQCVKYLFEDMGAEELVFDYVPTPRNGPIQDFFFALLKEPASPGFSLEKETFYASAPKLFHRVVDAVGKA